MKTLFRFLLIGLFVAATFALTAQAATVDGYVFLSGQTDHAGTRIVFAAASPSARTDSTLSASSGHYQIALQLGVYDVEFRHSGYTSFQRPDQILFVDTTLAAATLMQGIFGPQSGAIGPGAYDVIDTLRVLGGQTWTIAAGTQLLFRPQIPLIVNGTLLAIGTAEDSIVFAARIEHQDSAWSGVQFLSASGLCRMEYCVIEVAHGEIILFSTVTRSVGAVACVNSSPTIEHCSIRRNSGANYGAAIYGSGGGPVCRDCEFFNNTPIWPGSVAAFYGSAGALQRCWFRDNQDYETVYLDDSATTRLSGCTIVSAGYAVSTRDANPVIDSCLLIGDRSLWAVRGQPRLSQCTIAGEVRLGGGDPVIYNSILYNRGSSDPTISFESGTNATISYSAIFSTSGNAWIGYSPPAFGMVALTNANGDSCDTYYNIFLDPLFVDVTAEDYHLTLGSPCIDAGDPGLPHDPDGTVADMGAFYFDQLAVPERTAVRHYLLSQNYPNPFNARTRISFSIAQAGEVSLNVFDITGRLVSTLADGRMTAGTHEVSLDARDLPSGVYVYRLAAGNAVEAKKMILIR